MAYTTEDIKNIRAGMKARRLRIRTIARQLEKNESWVGQALRGDVPFIGAAAKGKAALPRELERILARWQILPKEGNNG